MSFSRPTDPFKYKNLSKAHPVRICYTIFARLQDKIAANQFDKYLIELKYPNPTNPSLSFKNDASDTAVTRNQLEVLIHCLLDTETLNNPVVEIGSYRGVTTKILAENTKRPYYAVDPYSGYGGAQDDLDIFKKRTAFLTNVTHLPHTSGRAASLDQIQTISFAFVDAVHDYVNARFDGITWASKLCAGGIIAFHDCDSRSFPGVQRAVWEIINKYSLHLQLFAHVDGLVALKRTET